MTMADGRCEVCGGPDPIGVAATIIPYSCAYCRDCLLRNAQPLLVFETIWRDVGGDLARLAVGIADLETHADGRYVTYREWSRGRVADRDKAFEGG